MNLTFLQEDFERQAELDSLYLQERQMEIEQEFYIPEFGEIEIDYELYQMETNYGRGI